jgi:hypothetical protein
MLNEGFGANTPDPSPFFVSAAGPVGAIRSSNRSNVALTALAAFVLFAKPTT